MTKILLFLLWTRLEVVWKIRNRPAIEVELVADADAFSLILPDSARCNIWPVRVQSSCVVYHRLFRVAPDEEIVDV